MSFSTLGLHADVLSVLDTLGYQTPTPIQLAAIPEVLAGHDVMAGAQTGTGKTAAFALPLIQRHLTREASEKAIRVLVLTPTRELAQQVYKSFVKYSQGSDFNFRAISSEMASLISLIFLAQGTPLLLLMSKTKARI